MVEGVRGDTQITKPVGVRTLPYSFHSRNWVDHDGWAFLHHVNSPHYSDGVVLGRILWQSATERAILRILGQFFFLPLYPYLRTICTQQSFIFFSYCVVVRHAHVGQKMSDLNDAELPHLEGLSRSVTEISHVLCPESAMVVVTHCHTCTSLDFGAQNRLWNNKNTLSTVHIFFVELPLAIIIHHRNK